MLAVKLNHDMKSTKKNKSKSRKKSKQKSFIKKHLHKKITEFETEGYLDRNTQSYKNKTPNYKDN